MRPETELQELKQKKQSKNNLIVARLRVQVIVISNRLINEPTNVIK